MGLCSRSPGPKGRCQQDPQFPATGLPCWGWWLIWTAGHREAVVLPKPRPSGWSPSRDPLSGRVGQGTPTCRALSGGGGIPDWLAGMVAHTLGG